MKPYDIVMWPLKQEKHEGKDGFNYQMLFEPLYNVIDISALFFTSHSNAIEKYYVLPSKGSEGMI